MSIASDFLAMGLDVLTEHFPAVFSWRGADYIGQASSTKDASQMREAGFMAESDLSIKISKSAFNGVIPTANQKITNGGVDYLIQTVTTGPDGSILTLACNRMK